MNTMFADGGLQTDYELSNINSVGMTPNGKYCIVGQSQGPPQIWDAIVRIIEHQCVTIINHFLSRMVN